jgi:SAM-dependent methyltransferase
VALLGVLHHLPGAHVRLRVLQEAAARLAPGGVLAFTVWRFATEPRFAGKVVPWAELNRRLRRPLDLAQLEEGDVLLPFGHDPTALRYCHGVGEGELAGWLAALPPVVDDYLADGAGGQLNRYLIFRAGP